MAIMYNAVPGCHYCPVCKDDRSLIHSSLGWSENMEREREREREREERCLPASHGGVPQDMDREELEGCG